VLAADRNILASERTYAAWVRTGLLALGAGIGARALKDVPNWIAVGALVMLWSMPPSIWDRTEDSRHSHRDGNTAILPGEPKPRDRHRQ
jgi:hypothetical protein